MKIKIALIFLFVSLFVSFAFCQENKNSLKAEVDKAVKEAFAENDKKLDSKLSALDEKYKREQTLEERLELKSENLKMKEAMIGWWLNILGILVAVFGVLAPVIISWRAWRVSERHEKEIERMELLRKNQETEFRKLKEEQEVEFNKIQKELKNKMEEVSVISDNVNQKHAEICKHTEEAKKDAASIKELHKQAESLSFKAERANLKASSSDSVNKSAISSSDELQYETIMNLVYAYTNAKKYLEALQEVDNAITLLPEKADAWFNKGYILNEQGEYEQALQMFDKAIKIYEDNPTKADCMYDMSSAYNNKGFAFAAMGNYEEAVKMYDKALSIDALPKTYSNKGRALFSSGNYTLALVAYDHAFQKGANDTNSFLGIADVLFQLARYEEALAKYDKAIELDIKDVRGYIGKLRTLNALNKFDDAVIVCNSIIQLDSLNAEAYYVRGCIHLFRLDFKEAIEDFDYVLSLNNKFSDVYSMRAAAYAGMEEYNMAFFNIVEALRINESSFIAYVTRACIYADQNNYLKAEEDFEKALTISSSSSNLAMLHEAKAWMYIIMNNGDRALSEILTAIQIDKKVLRYAALAAAYIVKNDFCLALEALNKYIENMKILYIDKKVYDKLIPIIENADEKDKEIINKIMQIIKENGIIKNKGKKVP